MPVLGTLAAASAEGFGFGRPFSPYELFNSGTVGAWYDISDPNILWQDSAGTTPVTTLGQPVGLVLDKSRALGNGVFGLQRMGRVNLLTYSEQLNNAAWGKVDASITANATTAPDGTTTADKVVVNTNSVVTRHEVQQGFSGTTTDVFQFSFYAKKSEITKVIGQLAGTAVSAEIEFDLNAGTSTQVYVSNVSNVAHSITALSDNWYLCKLEAKSTSANSINRAAVFQDSIGNGTNGWFLWGCDARLASNSSFPYQRTTDTWYGAVPGNHLTQATSAARPTWEARVNVLTRTEELENAAWTRNNVTTTVNPVTSWNGTGGTTLLKENTVNDAHNCYQTLTGLVATYEMTVYAKWDSGTRNLMLNAGGASAVGNVKGVIFNSSGAFVAIYNPTGAGTDPTYSSESLGNGWYKFKTSTIFTASGTAYPSVALMNGTTLTYAGDGTSGIIFGGIDLRLSGDNAYPYQKVVTATNYTDVGSPRYLYFDGVDDRMATPANVNLSSTNKLTAIAGVRKLRDTVSGANTIGMVAELTIDAPANNGGFWLAAPDTANAYRYSVLSRGTSFVLIGTNSTTYNAPVTNVQTGVMNIGAPSLALRLNGTQVASSTSSQGTGNYANASLFVGSRNGAVYLFQGNMYQLIVYGDAASGNTLNNLERWVAGRTGVSW